MKSDRVRFLIDTNIFIPLEAVEPAVEHSAFELCRIAGQHRCQIILHPASLSDLQRDTCSSRRSRNLAMMKKYPVLDNPPRTPEDFRRKLRSKLEDAHDHVDDALLYALARNCADFLVTEDLKIHAKARRVGLQERVCNVSQAIQIIQDLYGKPVLPPPALEDVPVHVIPDTDPIWESLRSEYPDFDDWLSRVKREGRKAWVCFGKGGVCEALCIYKQKISEHPETRGKALKLCSFKVRPESWGRNLGELLLKAAFNYCDENECASVYFTVFGDRHPRLVVLAKEFGFAKGPNKTDLGEDVFIKKMKPDEEAARLDALTYHVRYGPPAFKLEGCKKFIVPIRPVYHQALFPDAQAERELFAGHASFGNTIKKAYICHSPCHSISPGDLLLFYRSGDLRAVTTVGVVEKTLVSKDPSVVAAFVSKRTVYPMQEIVRLCEKEVLVILFRQAKHLRHRITYDELAEAGLIHGAVQSITQVKDGINELLVAHR